MRESTRSERRPSGITEPDVVEKSLPTHIEIPIAKSRRSERSEEHLAAFDFIDIDAIEEQLKSLTSKQLKEMMTSLEGKDEKRLIQALSGLGAIDREGYAVLNGTEVTKHEKEMITERILELANKAEAERRVLRATGAKSAEEILKESTETFSSRIPSLKPQDLGAIEIWLSQELKRILEHAEPLGKKKSVRGIGAKEALALQDASDQAEATIQKIIPVINELIARRRTAAVAASAVEQYRDWQKERVEGRPKTYSYITHAPIRASMGDEDEKTTEKTHMEDLEKTYISAPRPPEAETLVFPDVTDKVRKRRDTSYDAFTVWRDLAQEISNPKAEHLINVARARFRKNGEQRRKVVDWLAQSKEQAKEEVDENTREYLNFASSVDDAIDLVELEGQMFIADERALKVEASFPLSPDKDVFVDITKACEEIVRDPRMHEHPQQELLALEALFAKRQMETQEKVQELKKRIHEKKAAGIFSRIKEFFGGDAQAVATKKAELRHYRSLLQSARNLGEKIQSFKQKEIV